MGCWLRVVNVGCGSFCCLPEKLSFFLFLLAVGDRVLSRGEAVMGG